jgi:hypothetical protein
MFIATGLLVFSLPQRVVLSQDVPSGTEFPSVSAIPEAGFEEAFATYDPSTGNVYLSVGQGLGIIGLGGFPFSFDDLRPELAEEFEQIANGPGGEITFLTFAEGGFANTGLFNMGALLPANPSINTAAKFRDEYPDARLRASAIGQPNVLSQFNVIGIPEPSCFAFLGFVSICVTTRRRRSGQPN